MDRPSRKTKAVNYCESKDFEDDEDFAFVKAPPSKKAREDARPHEHKKPSSKSSSQESVSSQSHKSRKPLDEKLLARDLEAAITLSLLNNVDCVEQQGPTLEGPVKTELLADENTDPSSLRLSNCSVDISRFGLDQITPERHTPAPAKQKKAASKAADEQRRSPQKDDDYEPRPTPDSDSDEDFSEPDESDDEEFKVKKNKKTTKKEKVGKNDKPKPPPASKKEKKPAKPAKSKSQPAAASPQVKSPPTVKYAAKRPTASPAAAATISTSKPVSPAGAKIPKWTPPAKIGTSPTSSNSPTLKSPGQGLRLGLSRLVRVKPLHPSVASH